MKCTIKKFEGDDQLSWAVFKAEDVKGKGSIIFYGQAKPIVSGLSRRQAQHHKRLIEERE